MDRRAMALLRELARDAGSPVVVRGDCMEPMLRSGSTVSVRAKRVYLPGDVIVFRTRGGDLAAHRVLGWRPAGLVTKGDHCTEHDAPVGRDEIVGAVQARIGIGDRVRALGALARIVLERLAR
jgi:signal peptidase I